MRAGQPHLREVGAPQLPAPEAVARRHPLDPARERVRRLDGIHRAAHPPPQLAVQRAGAGPDLEHARAAADLQAIEQRMRGGIPQARLRAQAGGFSAAVAEEIGVGGPSGSHRSRRYRRAGLKRLTGGLKTALYERCYSAAPERYQPRVRTTSPFLRVRTCTLRQPCSGDASKASTYWCRSSSTSWLMAAVVEAVS